MQLINLPQAFENSEHNGFGKDLTNLKKSDESRIGCVIEMNVCGSACFTLFYRAVCLDFVRL